MKILCLLVSTILCLTFISSREIKVTSPDYIESDTSQIVLIRARFIEQMQVRHIRFGTPDEINFFELVHTPVSKTKIIISVNYGKSDFRRSFFVPGVVYIIKAKKIFENYYNISTRKASEL